jgi:phosphohistidine phosphatase SixA
VGPRVGAALMPLLLVRHASAGDRDKWQGNDRERPLDERGRKRAADLVGQLEPYSIEAILSSPADRCVETVEPLARARGVEIEQRLELSEEVGMTEGIALVRSLADRKLVVCGHGGLEQVLADPPRWKKGMVFVVGPGLELLAVL